jgi:circadian clock protein KaiB
VLRLYVAGNSIRSQHAIENVKRICDDYLRDRCELEVIDIYQAGDALSEDIVLAAPTLIRKLPLPLRRVIGDMNEQEKVLLALDLVPRPRTEEQSERR